jgi:hypothetical protein
MRPFPGGSGKAQRLALGSRSRSRRGGLVRGASLDHGAGPQDRAADEAGESDAAEGEAEAADLCQPGQSEEALAPARGDDRNPLHELKLLLERAPRPEEERFDGGHRERELVRDLGVRQPLDLAQEDRLALGVGQAAERVPDIRRRRPLRVVQREEQVGVELDLLRTLGAKPRAAANDVAGDGQEPGLGLLRAVTSAHGPEGVQERRLGDVLGFFGIADVAQHRSVHLAPVPAVDPLERAIRVHE